MTLGVNAKAFLFYAMADISQTFSARRALELAEALL